MRIAYSVEEAAEMVSIKRTLMYQLVGNGEVPSFTVGRRRLIPHEGLVAWVQEQVVTNSGEAM